MKIPESVPVPENRVLNSAFAVREAESFKEPGYFIRGDVFFKMWEGSDTNREPDWQDERRNLVVLDASILIARLVKNNSETPHGLFALAVGSGDIGWNPMSPPAPTNTQRALYSEITRKTFSNTTFINPSDGSPVAYPTKVVDFTTIFTESEAVGPLVEMGLLGGNVDSNMLIRKPVSPANGSYNAAVNLTNYDTLFNYLTFKVVNKPATSTFEITWRLTF